MLISIITMILFAVSIVGLLLYPKTEGRLNGMKMTVFGIMAVFCYLALWAAIYSKLGIAVGLPSACVALLLMNGSLWGGILYRRRVQKLFWRWTDALYMILSAAFVIWLAMHVFTPELRAQYYNVDAAAHFSYANMIVKWKTIPFLTYFSAYVDAFFIQLMAPALSTILYFKAFIIADIFMHLMEIWMIYWLFLTISEKRVMRVMAPVLSVGYFWGYPAYSFTEGHFVYWSNGVVILIFLIYALLLIERHVVSLKYSVPLLLLGLYANACCNKLFVLTNTAAVFAVLGILLLQKYWSRVNKKQLAIGAAVAMLLLVGAVGGYLWLWKGSLVSLAEDLIKPGGIYSSLYADQMFFLPALFYVVYDVLKHRRREKTIVVVSVCMLLIAFVMYVAMSAGDMSGYYYHKIDYNLWLCGWLLGGCALATMAETKQLTWFFSYVGMLALIAYITLTDYDAQLAGVHEDYNGEYATTQLFSIYRYNADNLQLDYEEFRISDLTLDVFSYAIEEMQDTNVCIVTENWNLQVWHDGMDLTHAQGFDFSEYELTELLLALDERGVQAIIVQREDEKYNAYEGYFSQCVEIYGNQETAILAPAGEKWFEIPNEVRQYAADKMELFDYVAEHFAGTSVPLMADQSAYYDYLLYYEQTGNLSSGVYPWHQISKEELAVLSDEEKAWITARTSIGVLAEQDVEYIVVQNGDPYYELVKSYMDTWECIYENNAGKILVVNAEDE